MPGEHGDAHARARDGELGQPRILRDSLRSFFSSSVSSSPSSTIDPASGTTLNATFRGKTAGSGRATAPPSCTRPTRPGPDPSAAAASAWAPATAWARSSSAPASPAPETAWYVATIRRSSPASSASGLRTGIAAIVVQFGLAMIPLRASRSAPGFTSETTSGTSGSMRHAEGCR